MNINYHDLNSILENLDEILASEEKTPTEILKYIINVWTHSNLSLDNQKDLINKMIKKGADLNQVIKRCDTQIGYQRKGILTTTNVLSDEMLEFLMDIGISRYDILKHCLGSYRYEFIQKHSLNEIKIRADDIMLILSNFYKYDFEKSVKALNTFPDLSFNSVRVLLESKGLSNALINSIYKFIEFVKDYIENKYHLSDVELNLLENKPHDITKENFYNVTKVDSSCFPIEEYMHAKLINKHFNIIGLSIIGGHYKLAHELVDMGIGFDCKDLVMLSYKFEDWMMISVEKSEKFNLVKRMIDSIDSVDTIINESGETLIDQFLGKRGLLPYVLNKTQDIAYQFLKEDAACESLSYNNSKSNIAITHGSDFWSIGAIGTGRVAMKHNPSLQFFMLDPKTIDRCGDELLNNIDGFINPGAADSFPTDKKEFSLQDVESLSATEEAYQKVIGIALNDNIPYFGMCAGAQNFVLKNNGYLFPLYGYSSGSKVINLKESSMIHYLSMNESERYDAENYCEFAKISYKGDTAHNYAAVLDKLGNNINLGGVSEGNVAMAYSHENAIHFATQYHPEHKYSIVDFNRQKLLLNSFFNLTVQHRDARIGSEEPVHERMQYIQDKLRSCSDRVSKVEYDDYSVFVDQVVVNDMVNMETIVVGDFLSEL